MKPTAITNHALMISDINDSVFKMCSSKALYIFIHTQSVAEKEKRNTYVI